nr:uncharacterized protein LOC109168309 [Ipomoea batatas]
MATPTQSPSEAKTIDILIADLTREKGWIDDNKGYIALRIMVWTGNTSKIRPQALHPETTAPAPAVSAAAPMTNVNAIFDPNDSASPFFLHPKEIPSLVLISTVLDGQNYHPWARAMEMALLSKNKLGFIDGTMAMPNVNDVKFPYWKRCNNMVSTWIMRSLSSEIAQTVIRHLLTCNCLRRCDCELLDKLQMQLDSDNLFAFLRGLNDSYGSVQSQIMMMKPLPSVDEDFLIVQQ